MVALAAAVDSSADLAGAEQQYGHYGGQYNNYQNGGQHYPSGQHYGNYPSTNHYSVKGGYYGDHRYRRSVDDLVTAERRNNNYYGSNYNNHPYSYNNQYKPSYASYPSYPSYQSYSSYDNYKPSYNSYQQPQYGGYNSY